MIEALRTDAGGVRNPHVECGEAERGSLQPTTATPQRRDADRVVRPIANGSTRSLVGLGQAVHALVEQPSRGPYVALNELDPEFAEVVSHGDRHRARALLAPSYRLSAGAVALPTAGVPDTTFAFLILRGSLIDQTEVATRRMIAFLSSGDLLTPFTPRLDTVRGRVTLRATDDVLLAALDQRFIHAAAIWPRLMMIVQRRLCEQQHRIALHGAICQLPRVDQRILALMWLLADRIGKVTGEGVMLTQPFNHKTLAELVGARRPTVSLAVKLLRERDHLRRRPDGTWLLPHREDGQLPSFDDLVG